MYNDSQRYIFPNIHLLSPNNEVRILLLRWMICSQLYVIRKAEQGRSPPALHPACPYDPLLVMRSENRSVRERTLIGAMLLSSRSFCAACTFRDRDCFLLWKAHFPGWECLLSMDGKLWRVVDGQKLKKEKSPVFLGEEQSRNYVGNDLNVTRPQLLMWN